MLVHCQPLLFSFLCSLMCPLLLLYTICLTPLTPPRLSLYFPSLCLSISVPLLLTVTCSLSLVLSLSLCLFLSFSLSLSDLCSLSLFPSLASTHPSLAQHTLFHSPPLAHVLVVLALALSICACVCMTLSHTHAHCVVHDFYLSVLRALFRSHVLCQWLRLKRQCTCVRIGENRKNKNTQVFCCKTFSMLRYDSAYRCLCVHSSMSSPLHLFSHRRLSVLICLPNICKLLFMFSSFSAAPLRIASLALLLNVE